MKKLLITVAAVLATLNVFAQGTSQGFVDFRNSAGLANSGNRIYVGTYGGGSANYAAGGLYSVGLYYAADGVTDESMFTLVGTGAPVLAGGIFQGGSRTVDTATPGGPAMFQLRGWSTALGSSYEQVRSSGQGSVGKSGIFRAASLKDPNVTPKPTPDPITNYGIVGFALTPVPEPSAVVLGILGAGALLLLRRRK